MFSSFFRHKYSPSNLIKRQIGDFKFEIKESNDAVSDETYFYDELIIDESNDCEKTKTNDVTLYYGKNVEGITRTTDKTELYNAITPVGKDGASVKDLERTVLDSDGNVKYFTKKGSYAIYAPQSMAIYPSKVIGTYNGYIHKFHSFEGISDSFC